MVPGKVLRGRGGERERGRERHRERERERERERDLGDRGAKEGVERERGRERARERKREGERETWATVVPEKVLVSTMSAPDSKYRLWISLTMSGRVSERRSLFPFRSFGTTARSCRRGQ